MPQFPVDRSIEIKASPEQVYGTLRDLTQWVNWSPWVIAEPDCKLTYAEDGRSYDWDGEIIGSGRIEIVGEAAPHRLDMKLLFFKPFETENTTAFELTEVEGGVKVRWTMVGNLPWFMFFMAKMMANWVGMDYDRGLNQLKDLVETGDRGTHLKFVGKGEVKGFSYVGIRTTASMAEIGESMSSDLKAVDNWMKEHGIPRAGPAVSFYPKWDIGKGTCTYISGFAVDSIPSDLPSGFIGETLPDVPVYSIRHQGPYRHLGNAWSAGMMHQRAKLFSKSKQPSPFEIYENDPELVPEEDLITVVHMPRKA